MGENKIAQEVLDKVKAAADDNKLACPTARRLADELSVPDNVIGEACNELNIKIKNCSLGCF